MHSFRRTVTQHLSTKRPETRPCVLFSYSVSVSLQPQFRAVAENDACAGLQELTQGSLDDNSDVSE